MKNQEFKKQLVSDGTFQKYMTSRKLAFQLGQDNSLYLQQLNEETLQYEPVFNEEIFSMSEDEAIECERMRRNKNKQVQKIEEHIRYLFSLKNVALFFATFTFSDETLDTTSAKTRHRKVIQCLGANCIDYIVNIDYGTQNEREHYHALIAVDLRSVEVYLDDKGHFKITGLDAYKYGFYSLERIKTAEIDEKRLSRYITKLTFHSIKVKQSYVSVKKGSFYVQDRALDEAIKYAKNASLTDYQSTSQRISSYVSKRDFIRENDDFFYKVFDLFGYRFDMVGEGDY